MPLLFRGRSEIKDIFWLVFTKIHRAVSKFLVCTIIVHVKYNLHKGAFNNYVDRILPFFDPPPLRGQFLYPERGQKQTFFDPLPPLILST